MPVVQKNVTFAEYEWHSTPGQDVGGQYDREQNYDYLFDGINNADFLQKNLDATKNIGYPCREEGAYGSHSSHDGFDDESEA